MGKKEPIEIPAFPEPVLAAIPKIRRIEAQSPDVVLKTGAFGC